MSASRRRSSTPADTSRGKTAPDVGEIARENPQVEEGKVREALEVLEELDRKGVIGPSYGIVSPYQRRPLRKMESGEPNLK